MILKAPAKINLTLEVLGKRKDGYHEIRSIMQTVSLYDVLYIDHADSVQLTCNAAELQNEENLIMTAIAALKKATGYTGGAMIHLDKHIPWASGLGGGSSDAAATLKGLNSLWSLGIPPKRLAEIAAGIGSDVPFFIFGGTCMVEGRGEKLVVLPDMPETWMVLLKPPLMATCGKTGKLYSMIDPVQYTKGEYTDGMKRFISTGSSEHYRHQYNIFDSVTARAYPGLDKFISSFSCAGAAEIHLAGSGPVLFTLAQDEGQARGIQGRLKARDIQSFVVCSTGRGEIDRD